MALPLPQVGLEQAKIAERNREQIDAVFLDLNEQIAVATDDKVTVSRQQYSEPQDLMQSLSLKPSQKYWAITAEHKAHKEAPEFKLARWKQPPEGYPCKISFGERDVYCENRQALEKALDNLLRSPNVGEAFLSLMNFAPKSTP